MVAARSLGPALVLVPALLGWSLAANASVVVPLDLPALVAHADRVVVGTIEGQSARWTTGHDAIYTDVTIRVSRSLKGDANEGDAVTFRREGGEVEGRGMRIFGAASFTVGEEVVLFLERRGAAYWTVGMAQGKMHVTVVDGRRFAVRSVAGLEFTKSPTPEPAARPLEELLAAIDAEAHRVKPTPGAGR